MANECPKGKIFVEYSCSRCYRSFPTEEECEQHIKKHESEKEFRQVHLAKHYNGWEFTYTKPIGVMSVGGNMPEQGIHRNDSNSRDWPIWWKSCEATPEEEQKARVQLARAAKEWYSKRVKEIQKVLDKETANEKED